MGASWNFASRCDVVLPQVGQHEATTMGNDPKPGEDTPVKPGENSPVENKPDYANEPKPGQQPKPQQPR